MRGKGLIVVGSILCCASSTIAQEPPAEEVVVTAFGWPVGTEASVDTYQRMVRAGDGSDSDIVIEGSYDFAVAAHDEGVLVRHGNFSTTNFSSVPELPPENPLSVLYSRLGSVTPNYVVSPSGELIRVEGVEEMRDRMREALQPLVDSLPEQGAALNGMIQQLTSGDYLFNQLSEQWNLMVGFWIDAELELGAVYEFEDQAPSPLIPTELIPFVFQFSAAERVPCSDVHAPDSCVRFEFRSVPDPDIVAELIKGWLEQLGAVGADAAIDSLEQENTVSLIAEAGTLLPHRWEMSRSFSMTGKEDGDPTEATRSDKSVYVFTYR
jgi:hypothetical protein